MPYKSIAQARYFNANKPKLEAQGIDVDEFNAASKGKKLPAKAPPNSRQSPKIKRLAQALMK